MKALDEAEFTIVGTGLMGSSLALALRGKVKALNGVERNEATLQVAAPYFDTVTADLGSAATSDVIVLATPIRTILHLLKALALIAKPGTLILDLGSTKSGIVAAMNTLPDHLLAVGGHPMCGKEAGGPGAADGALYRGKIFALCDTLRTTPEARAFAVSMVKAIGAHELTVSAAQHDHAVAKISHLPHVLSIGLVGAVMADAQDDPTAWNLASTGFRDTSRLAGSDVTMLTDILLTNREAVLSAIAVFDEQIGAIKAAVVASDEAKLRAILEEAKQARSEWHQSWKRRTADES
jgi:prephenate dehydrogenase